MANDDLLRAVRAELSRQGWRLIDGTCHTRAIPPEKDKPVCHIPTLHGRRGEGGHVRARRNMLAQLRASGFRRPPGG
jgi:hypothetical protein